MESFLDKVNARRVRVDALIKVASNMTRSAETTLAQRALQGAKHHLENALCSEGMRVTYPFIMTDLETREQEIVVEMEGVATKPAFELSTEEGSDLKNINAIRKLIQDELVSFGSDFTLYLHAASDLVKNYLYAHHTKLSEALNWYGEDLSRMRQLAKESEVKEKVATKAESKAEKTPKEKPAKDVKDTKN